MISLMRRMLVACIAASIALPVAAQEKPAASPEAKNATLVVFAAASLKNALDAIAIKWKAASGNSVTFSYAASGPLAKQIENGAPCDIFAAADLKWMDYAADKKLIKPETRKNLLGNTLVLIAQKDSDLQLKIAKGFELARIIGDGRIAMGDPNFVPAGTYAKAALTSLGVWTGIAPKVAGAENVRAALAYVARGEAKLGIVYRTDAAAEPKVKVVDTFPAGTHPPIVYPFAVTASSSNRAASEFLAYLATPAAAQVFEAEGFTVLP